MYALRPTPIVRNILTQSKHSGMYKHVIVRLKHRPGQKTSEVQAIRNEIDKIVSTDFADDIAKVHNFEQLSTFVWELNTPYDTPQGFPSKMRNFLDTWKTVDNYSPAISTKEEEGGAPASYENIMASFKQFSHTFEPSQYDAYGLRLYPLRNHPVPIRELSTSVRDGISAYMETEKGMYSERSPQIKQMFEKKFADMVAHAAANNLPEPTEKPKLTNFIELQLDMIPKFAYWSTFRFNGPSATKTREEIKREKEEIAAKLTPQERIGQRIIIVKIGEIFLKKGNRFKFMMQLQGNMRTKLRGKAAIHRSHHFYVITPAQTTSFDKDTGKNFKNPILPFTDAEITEISEILKAVPGVEHVNIAYRTNNDIDSIIASTQHLLTLGSLHAKADVSAMTPLLEPSMRGASSEEEQAALDITCNVTGDKSIITDKHREVSKNLVNVLKMGYSIEPHTHQPCPFPSKSALQRQLYDSIRVNVAKNLGMDEPIPFPGEVFNAEQRARGIESDVMWINPRSGVNLRVEVTVDYAYICFDHGPDKMEAVGGQPTGTGSETQTVVALLSGGMDSPVAAFSLMRRGMRVILVHFQNANLADESTVQHKIVQLAEHLSRYQIITILHIVPFSAIQDAIIMEVPSPARMLVYRRYMFHIATKVAHRYSANFLVVGDALGQVASQTSSNLFASYKNAPMPILSPLIGSNKKDIMDIARQIGTYDISALPYGDCCSYFLAKHPLTKIKHEVLMQYERAVGQNVEGGASVLVDQAYHASGILRWHKADMEVVKEVFAVKSYHDNAASKLLLTCPQRNEMNDGQDMEEEVEMNDDEMMKKYSKKLDENDDQDIELNEESIDTMSIVKNDLESGISTPTAVPKRTINNLSTPPQDDDVTFTKRQKVTMPAKPVTNAFLDNASTTQVFPSVVKAMMRYYTDLYANSSSTHGAGMAVNEALDEAKRVLLGSLSANTAILKSTSRDDAVNTGGQHLKKKKDQLMVFTSGGTESNNIAILGSVKAAVESLLTKVKLVTGSHVLASNPMAKSRNALVAKPVQLHVRLITSPLEHHAILEPLRDLASNGHMLVLNNELVRDIGAQVELSFELLYVRNDQLGAVDVQHLEQLMAQEYVAPKNVNGVHLLTFVSIMHANNEVGIVQPLVEIGKAVEAVRAKQAATKSAIEEECAGLVGPPSILFHTDACQSYGKLHLDVNECNLDLVTINAHKVYGPKGVGALYIRPGTDMVGIMKGGGHQGDLRSGTLNVPSIIGLAAAAAELYGIKTAFLDTRLSMKQVTDPVERAFALPVSGQVTSVGVNHPSNLALARKMQELRCYLFSEFPRSYVNGPLLVHSVEQGNHRAANTSEVIATSKFAAVSMDEYLANFSVQPQVKLPNILSIVLDRSTWMDNSSCIKYLSAHGVFVSSGSACASNGEPAPSHVLLGMGLRADLANSTVRISLSHFTSDEELVFAKNGFKKLADNMRANFKPQGR